MQAFYPAILCSHAIDEGKDNFVANQRNNYSSD